MTKFNDKNSINILESKDDEIKYIEEMMFINSIYTTKKEGLIQKIKNSYKTIDNGIKKNIKLALIGVLVLLFVTLSFYIIKYIYT